MEGDERFTLRGPSAHHAIYVTLPPGYDPDRADPYPVLYYGDAWWLGDLVSGTARIAALARPDAFEPVVLVGIGVVGDEVGWNVQRNRDFTPSPVRMPRGGTIRTVGNGAPMDSAGTGGAAAFFGFLRDDLAPRIEASYHVDVNRRGWLGHSLGGLFGAWAHTQDPAFFNDLVLISPAVYWGEGIWGNEKVMDSPLTSDATVFIAYGMSENEMIKGPSRDLAEFLVRAGAAAELRAYDGRDHHSLLGAAVWDGLVHLYGQ